MQVEPVDVVLERTNAWGQQFKSLAAYNRIASNRCMLVVWLFSKRSSSFIHQRYEDAKLQQKVQRHLIFF